MKKLLSILLVITISITFVACGGGGGGSGGGGTPPSSNVSITVSCTTVSPASPTTSDISTYHEVFSGDSIVQDNASTIIQIYTPIGSNSRVCLQSGSAHIVRN